MKKNIRFPLKLAGGFLVHDLKELREHFDLQSVLEYYKSGKLLTWLDDRYLEGEAEAIRALDEAAPDFQQRLCSVFQVEYTGAGVDMEEIERRQERLKRLRTITDEAEYIQNIDKVAFDQEELADLLDEGQSTIYLCGENFIVPASRKGITYVGINEPAVHISGKVPETAEELGIVFTGVICDNLPKAPAAGEDSPQIKVSALDRKLVELFTHSIPQTSFLRDYYEMMGNIFSSIDSQRSVKRALLSGLTGDQENIILKHWITDDYLVFKRVFEKYFRLDLSTLDEVQISEPVYISDDGIITGNEIVWKGPSGRSLLGMMGIECFNVETLKNEPLADEQALILSNISDITDKFILIGSKLMIRDTGRMLQLDRFYHKIIGDWVYTVHQNPNYRYNPLTEQTEEVPWGDQEFAIEKICGDYIYGTVETGSSERQLTVLNQVTGEKRDLLHYRDCGDRISNLRMYQDYWILAHQDSDTNYPIVVYAVHLKTAEVNEIARLRGTIIGVIGRYFYYSDYDKQNTMKLYKVAIDDPEQVITLS